MIKPLKILLLILMVNLLLGIFILIFPTGEIKLSDDLSINFVSWQQLTHPQDVQRADITNIVNTATQDSSLEAKPATETPLKDNDTFAIRERKLEEENLGEIKVHLEYPEDKPALFNPIFASLDSLLKFNRQFRILHFGDSQIEGDRITSTFRESLQAKFGGCGPGIVPIFEASDIRSSIHIAHSENWKKYAIYGNLYKGYRSKSFGIQGSVFHYEAGKPAYVELSKSTLAYPKASKFELLRLLYGNLAGTTKVEVTSDDNIVSKETLPEGSDFQLKTWKLDSVPDKVKIEFASGSSPEIYGVGLDCRYGVAVDNIPMRGSSGTDFHHLDINYFSEQVRKLNVRMIILQYGVNVVPYIKGNTVDYFEKQFFSEIKSIHDHNHGVQVLVIGVSDMATKKGGEYASFDNIDKIRDAQKRAAFSAGCAYWDLYEAMGGNNSMLSWVRNKPSLAEKDFTHFNFRGARIIGDMIYKAFMSDYYAWKKSRKNA